MSAKPRKNKLVFYLGGPKAKAGYCYWVTADRNSFPGCGVADFMGAVIPTSTFIKARPEVSAEKMYCYRHKKTEGKNTTAILPL